MMRQVPLKVSLEGWWSPVFEEVLKTLNTPDHPVVNWSPYDHDRVAGERSSPDNPLAGGFAPAPPRETVSGKLTGSGLRPEQVEEKQPPLQRYMYQLARPVVPTGTGSGRRPDQVPAERSSCGTGNDAPSIHVYYNLHGLQKIYYPLEKSHFTPEQQQLYETAAERLLAEPDVIIYGFQPVPHELCSAGTWSGLRPEPVSAELVPPQGVFVTLTSQYEWLYDGDNTDIPVFKVNFGDAFCNVTAALHEILGLIHHHYHNA